MQKVTLIFAVAASFIFFSFKQPSAEKIKWLSIEELHAAYAKEPRPVLVDVYTSWCGWCKVMDKETYRNSNVADYINTHYYAVKFDAEGKDSVMWAGKKFGYTPQKRVHDLAVFLLGGQMSYPTTVFVPELNGQPAPLPGYLKPKEIEPPLKFFGDGAYKSKNFQEFLKTFTGLW
jgi:thioredoxin-related protein